MEFGPFFLGACTVLAATSLGAAGVFLFKKIEGRAFALIVSFSAGVMSFSALEMVIQANGLAGPAVAVGCLFAGVVAFYLVDLLMPHVHLALGGGEMHDSKRKVAMLVGTITLHNVPEGFAVASAFAGSSPLGWLITMTIALQDIPEGLLVSAPVASYGVATRHSFIWGVFSGVVEFGGALFGYVFLRYVTIATPWALGFSAGAMTYVVLSELLPDALRTGNRLVAVAAFVIGFAGAWGFGLLFIH